MDAIIKTRGFLLLIVVFLISSVIIPAQVIVTLEKPPLNQLKSEHIWKLQLNNTTQDIIKAILVGTISKSDEGKIFEATSSNIEIKPGMKRIKLADLGNIKVLYGNKKYEEMLIRTGSVPEGEYEICVSVLNAEDKNELGQGCITQNIQQINPPELIAPENNKTITETKTTNLVFQWLPPTPLPISNNYSYTFKLVEVLANQTPEDAIHNNLTLFEKEGISATNFKYPSSAPKLRSGNTYGWQISVKDKDGKLICPPSIAGAVVVVLFTDDYEDELSLKLKNPIGVNTKEAIVKYEWDFCCNDQFKLLKAKTPNLEEPKYKFFLSYFFLPEIDDEVLAKFKMKPEDIKKNIIYTKDGISEKKFVYPPDAPQLKKDGFYIWWVEASYNNKIYSVDTAAFFFNNRTDLPSGNISLKSISINFFDYGDAPDPTYPSLFASDGARHKWGSFSIHWIHIWGIWFPVFDFWMVEDKRQAWLGPLPTGYTGTLPPPGSDWDCSDFNVENSCNPLNNGLDFELEAKVADIDNFDDGVYFFPPSSDYCCDSVPNPTYNPDRTVDVMVHINEYYDRVFALYLMSWIDWDCSGNWEPTEATHLVSVTPVWGTTVAPTVMGWGRIKIETQTWEKCCAIYRLKFKCQYSSGSPLLFRFRLFQQTIPTVMDIKGETISGEDEDYLIKCEQVSNDTCTCGTWNGINLGYDNEAINLVQCGGTAESHIGLALVKIDPDFTCNPNTIDCQPIYTLTIKRFGDVVLSQSNMTFPSPYYEYIPVGAGQYEIIITPQCGTNTCHSCNIFFTIKKEPIQICDCGAWTGIELYYNNVLQPEDQCGSSASSVSAGTIIKINPLFNCIPNSPDCQPVYLLIIKRNGSADIIQTSASFPYTYIPTLPGNYEFIISPECNGDTCGSCNVFVKVTENNPCFCNITKILVDGSNLNAIHIGETHTLTVDGDICAGTNCSVDYIDWTITPPAGSPEHIINDSATYTFSQANGTYVITAVVYCNDGSSCSYTFNLICKP